MVFIRWHPLPDDYVKVNFDESVHLERETAAIAFARLQEERLAEDNQRVYQGSSNRPVETTKVGPFNANTSSRNLPTRGLTREELNKRSAPCLYRLGLCWNCDEKWHKGHGHRCKQKTLFLIEAVDEPTESKEFADASDDPDEDYLGDNNEDDKPPS